MRKKCWKCKSSAFGNGENGIECNYLASHERSRTIQAYEACGVKHPTPETDRMLSGETCAFFEPGARVYRKIESVVLPGSNPKAVRKERERKQDAYNWDLARTLHGQGLHDAEIGEALGCSATTVYEWRRREGLPPIKRRTETRYDWDKARAMYAEGAGNSAIARALGCSLSAVKAWKNREELTCTATAAPVS